MGGAICVDVVVVGVGGERGEAEGSQKKVS